MINPNTQALHALGQSLWLDNITREHIRLSVARSDGAVSIRVRDNGMGIAAAMLPRVFDLYAQAPGVTEHAQGGVGIGLHLVQHLVRLHHGTVTVTSAGVGLGSEFEVRLASDAVAILPA